MAGPASLSFEVVPDWEQLPAGWAHRDAADVAVDSQDRVYVITRGQTRVIVYDRDGAFIRSWGEDFLSDRPHGITIGPDDSVYCIDENHHAVFKCTPEGRVLMTLGTPDAPSDTGCDSSLPDLSDRLSTIVRGGAPFNRPTKLAIAPSGDLYVSDGYGNARVHRFSADGHLIRSWGEPGIGPSQFNLPHSLWVAADGRVLVADRENDRIQIFSPEGDYLEQWEDLHRPAALFIDRDGLIYVTELWWRSGHRSFVHGTIQQEQHARVSVLDPNGQVLARLGGPDSCAAGSFSDPHGICVDSRGDLYVAEVTYSGSGRFGLVPPHCHTFQKLTRRPGAR